MQSTWRSVHSNWPSVHVHNIPTIPVTDIRSRQEKAIYYFWSRWKTILPKGLSSRRYLSPPVQSYSSSSARARKTQSCGPRARARPDPAPPPRPRARGGAASCWRPGPARPLRAAALGRLRRALRRRRGQGGVGRERAGPGARARDAGSRAGP